MTRTTTTVWTDPDVSDLIADDPELVAIADALLATAPPSTHRRRNLPVRLGALAAALAVVVALVLVAPWNGGSPALADRALAALGDDPVLHVVTRMSSPIRYVNLRSGVSHLLYEREETWYDRSRGFVHTITRLSGGSLLDDELETPQGGWTPAGPVLDCTWIAAHPKQATKLRVSCHANGKNGTKPHVVLRPVPNVEPALGAFLDGYQQALTNGRATVTGTGRVDGRRVIWLTFPYGRETESVAIDASTFRPLLVRDESGTERYRIVSIGTVSQSAANFARPTVAELGRQAISGGTVAHTKRAVDPAGALRALPGTLWLGRSFRNLPLAAIEREKLRTRFLDRTLAPRDGPGVELVYGVTAGEGVPDRTQPFVQLWESNSAQPGFWWVFLQGFVPPAGTLATRSPARSLGAGLPAFLVRHGTFVTVFASSSKLALEAARTLRPISLPPK
jgi:hypothetical protein